MDIKTGMKSIERRASEYAKKQTKPYKNFDSITYRKIYFTFYFSYLKGAKDQKQREFNKAYGYLKARKLLTEASLESFKKVMEEQL